jgi:hypothetical protein
MGAGGGGGGGGNGGGNNGGSVTDPCWTGGPGLGPGQGLYTALPAPPPVKPIELAVYNP